jgi:hypothetical protein
MPLKKKIQKNKIAGKIKFIIDPAKITSILAGKDLEEKPLGTGASPISIPAILLYPPNGTRRKEYKVSLDLLLYKVGPKPMANSSTRIPVNLAVKKCPISWTVIKTPKTSMAANNVNKIILR